jgi:hypothetical protein
MILGIVRIMVMAIGTARIIVGVGTIITIIMGIIILITDLATVRTTIQRCIIRLDVPFRGLLAAGL